MWWTLGILTGLLVLHIVIPVPENSTRQGKSVTESAARKAPNIPSIEVPRKQEPNKNVSEAISRRDMSADESKRIDPPGKASDAEIGKVLRETKAISVSCGDDADTQTCKFFVNALSVALQKEHVSVYLYHDPEVLAQSFFVPPRLLPSLNVTLRLIESGPPQSVRLYLGGTCFDPEREEFYTGLKLPEWVQIEGGNDYGPLETDKAKAAGKTASAFASYWRGAATLASQ